MFESCNYHVLLSATWVARKKRLHSLDQMAHLSLSRVQLAFVEEFVIDGGYSHDEILTVLRELNIPELTENKIRVKYPA